MDTDLWKALNLVRNPDGSVTRLSPFAVAGPNRQKAFACSYKDVTLDPALNTSLRLYLPSDLQPQERVPVIMYFHGGGFVVGDVDNQMVHEPCLRMSADVRVLVISVNYRLAPEHRLPTAYDDAMEAVRWLRDQADAGGDVTSAGDSWVVQHADLSRCFLAGLSAGGNIAYHVAVRLASLPELIAPIRFVGVIIDQPFLGGLKRKESEELLQMNTSFPLAMSDLMWELALPEGVDRDHEYSNPMARRQRESLPPLSLPRCLVRGHRGDLMIDRQLELVVMLQGMGVDVVARIAEGGSHGAEVFDVGMEDIMIDQVREFVNAAPAAS